MKRSMIALVAMVGIALGGTACGPAPEQTEAPTAPEAGEVQAQACGDWGYYTCPSDNETFEYEAAGCGTPPYLYKPNAHTRCENHCPVACVDSGWFPGGEVLRQ